MQPDKIPPILPGFGEPKTMHLNFYKSSRDRDDVLFLHEGGFPGSCPPSWQRIGMVGVSKEVYIFRVGSEIARLNGISDPVIVMGLCEIPHIMLRPNQLYRFVVMPGCKKCEAAAAPFGDIENQNETNHHHQHEG